MRNGFFRTQHTYGLDLPPPPYLPSIPRVRVRVCARPRSPPNENMGAFFFSFFFFSFFHFFPSRLLYVYTDDTLSLARPLFLSLYIICEMRACVYFSIYVCIYPCTIRCRVLLRDNAPSATTTTAPLFAGPSETREEKKNNHAKTIKTERVSFRIISRTIIVRRRFSIRLSSSATARFPSVRRKTGSIGLRYCHVTTVRLFRFAYIIDRFQDFVQ